MANQAAATVAGYQEGSRWINERPPAKEVAEWFLENAPMHPGMNPKRYVTGVTLIPAKEKGKTMAPNGQIVDAPERLTYTPYVKVETRILYFRDYVRGTPEWVGAIEPDPDVKRLVGDHVTNEHLPPGFFRYPVVDQAGQLVHFLGCSMRVAIFERDMRFGGRGREVLPWATDSKIVPMVGRYGPDENALMKARTGAIGRALGVAGMLVLPGSGVATAEDVQEAVSGENRGVASGEAATLPADDDGASSSLRARANTLIARLESEAPGKLEEVQAWAREVKLPLLADIPEGSPQLRGVVRKLEQALGESG